MDGAENSLGFVPLTEFFNAYEKAQEVRRAIREMAKRYNIRHVFVEEDLQRFRAGFSSAHTLATLTRFNGIVCLIAYEELDLVPVHINVNEARKAIGLKIDKKDKSRTTKEKVFEKVSEMLEYDWPTKVIKQGKRKGQVENEKGCYDMADAFVIASAGLKLNL